MLINNFNTNLLSLSFLITLVCSGVDAFAPTLKNARTSTSTSSASLHMFGKMFEEEGPLGKGITVGKFQVGFSCLDRSLIEILEKESNSYGSEPEELSKLCNSVCLTMLRRQEDWISAGSESQWFSQKDSGKAERLYNDYTTQEAAKFEKEYVPSKESEKGGPTNVVVSVVVEIQGDETNFEGAGFSRTKTKEVLTSIASDCMIDDGYCLNAVEIFWTPGDREEVLTKDDIILDFPTLIDL